MAIAKAVVNSKQGHAQLVTKAVSSIVRTSSFRQMLSGLLAAGGVNAVQYVGRKISKAWRSRQ
jgi:translocator assembly and maintenance protein 41